MKGNDVEERRESMDKTIGLLLRSEHEWDNETERSNAMDELSDYVTNRIRQRQPITSTNWNGLVRASDTWHRDQVHVEMERRIGQEAERNEGKIRAWNSLVGQVEIIKPDSELVVRATPLTDPLQLYREGKEMSNCVGGYGDVCHSGESRIFSIRGSDGSMATMELTIRDNVWQPTQVKGLHNSTVTQETMGIAREIAKQYQAGWESTKEEDRMSREWIAVEDFRQTVDAAPIPSPRPIKRNEPTPGGLDLTNIPTEQVRIDPTLQLDAGRLGERIQQEREAERQQRVNERAAEYQGIPEQGGYQPRGGRGRMGY